MNDIQTKYLLIQAIYHLNQKLDIGDIELDDVVSDTEKHLDSFKSIISSIDDIYFDNIDNVNSEYIVTIIKIYFQKKDEIHLKINSFIKQNQVQDLGIVICIVLTVGYIMINYYKYEKDAAIIIFDLLTICSIFGFSKSSIGMVNVILHNISKNQCSEI